MTTLSTKELPDMRTVADDFFPDTCTIQDPTTTTGAMGGLTTSFASTYTGVACRVDPMGAGDESLVGEALQGQSGWWLNIPHDQAIDINYRVIHDSVTYEIQGVIDTQSYRTIRRAAMTRVG